MDRQANELLRITGMGEADGENQGVAAVSGEAAGRRGETGEPLQVELTSYTGWWSPNSAGAE